MLVELLGLAILGATVALKVKEEMPKSQTDWKDQDYHERKDNIFAGAEAWLGKSIEDRNRNVKKMLRTKSDDQISNALKNGNLESWKYDLLREEAERRGIL